MPSPDQTSSIVQLVQSLGIAREVADQLAEIEILDHNTASACGLHGIRRIMEGIKIKAVYGPQEYELRDGTKMYRVQFLGIDGKKRSKSYKSRAEATGIIDSALGGGMMNDKGKLSLKKSINEFIDEYILHCREVKELNKLTIDNYEFKLKYYFGGISKTSGITEEYLKNKYEERCKKVATATHHSELSIVKVFLEWLIDKGVIKNNPAKNIKPVGKKKRRKQQLLFSEVRKLNQYLIEQAASGEESALACLLALRLGMRKGEIAKLKTSDIDHVDDRVIVLIRDGKSEQANRWLPTDAQIGLLLMDRVRSLPAGYVFPSPTSENGMRSQMWVWRHIKQACAALGVQEICPHALRGIAATLQIATGSSPGDVARYLGHDSYGVTDRHYVAPGTFDRARIGQLDQFLGGENDGKTFPIMGKTKD